MSILLSFVLRVDGFEHSRLSGHKRLPVDGFCVFFIRRNRLKARKKQSCIMGFATEKSIAQSVFRINLDMNKYFVA